MARPAINSDTIIAQGGRWPDNFLNNHIRRNGSVVHGISGRRIDSVHHLPSKTDLEDQIKNPPISSRPMLPGTSPLAHRETEQARKYREYLVAHGINPETGEIVSTPTQPSHVEEGQTLEPDDKNKSLSEHTFEVLSHHCELRGIRVEDTDTSETLDKKLEEFDKDSPDFDQEKAEAAYQAKQGHE